MSFLRIAAVVIGLIAVPVLFTSAERLSARAREADRGTAQVADVGQGAGRLAAARAQDVRGAGVGAGPPGVFDTPGVFGSGGYSRGAPTFARIVIDPNGASSFEGASAPGAEVTLNLDARLLGKVRADPSGVWRLTVAQPMSAGDHNITSFSKSVDQARDVSGQEVRIAIPDAMVGEAVVAYETRPAEPPAGGRADDSAELRRRAEELAAAASERFDEIAPRAESTRQQTPRTDSDRAGGSERSGHKMAQAPDPAPSAKSAPAAPQALPPAVAKEPPAGPGADGIAAPVYEWLERSAREYQGTVVKGLSGSAANGEKTTGPASAESLSKSASGKAAPDAATPGKSSGADRGIGVDAGLGDALTDASLAVQEWLARANRSYQTEVVRKLEQPAVGSLGGENQGAKVAAPVAQSAVAVDDTAAKARELDAAKRRADEVRRLDDERRASAARRAAEAADKAPPKPIEQVKPLSAPPAATQQTAMDEAQPKRAADAAAVKKEADAARQRAVDAQRQADAQRQQDEAAKKLAEETRRKGEENARQKIAEDARQRAAAAKRLDDARSAEAAKAAAAAEAGKAATAAKSADLARKAIDAARTGPAKRAAEKQAEAAPAADTQRAGKGLPQPTPSGDAAKVGGAKSTEPGRAAKAAARPKDTRIAEGSGERGPVDKPAPARGKLDQSTQSGLGVDPPSSQSPSSQSGRSVKAAATSQPQRARTCGRAGNEITPPGTYVVAEGDTLSEIAERHYGTARRMGRIVKANRRKLGDPDLIKPCQRIYLP